MSSQVSAIRAIQLLCLLLAICFTNNAIGGSATGRGNCPTENRKVIYIDYGNIQSDQNISNTAVLAMAAGFNVVILSFYVTEVPRAADAVALWLRQSETQRRATLEYAHSKESCILVSAGGAFDNPYKYSGSAWGKMVANFTRSEIFDGVDFDVESIVKGFNSSTTDYYDWVIEASNTVRSVLGNDYAITHAPQAPYFGKIGSSTDWTGKTGGYSGIDKKTDNDWYNVQFYNQGTDCYVDYAGLFLNSSNCPKFPDTAFNQIVANGISPNKIVIGKPVESRDAGTGYMTPALFGEVLREARANGIAYGGYMGWEWSIPAETWVVDIGEADVFTKAIQ
jgi:chitinase